MNVTDVHFTNRTGAFVHEIPLADAFVFIGNMRPDA